MLMRWICCFPDGCLQICARAGFLEGLMEAFDLCGAYADERNNRVVVGPNTLFEKVRVVFKGSNNTLVISEKNKSLSSLNFEFSADNGVCVVGKVAGPLQARGNLRIGYNSLLVIGDAVT